MGWTPGACWTPTNPLVTACPIVGAETDEKWELLGSGLWPNRRSVRERLSGYPLLLIIAPAAAPADLHHLQASNVWEYIVACAIYGVQYQAVTLSRQCGHCGMRASSSTSVPKHSRATYAASASRPPPKAVHRSVFSRPAHLVHDVPQAVALPNAGHPSVAAAGAARTANIFVVYIRRRRLPANA
jgi:hypothetical protein